MSFAKAFSEGVEVALLKVKGDLAGELQPPPLDIWEAPSEDLKKALELELEAQKKAQEAYEFKFKFTDFKTVKTVASEPVTTTDLKAFGSAMYLPISWEGHLPEPSPPPPKKEPEPMELNGKRRIALNE